MNKPLIPVITAVGLLVGIGLFFVFQKPIFPDNKPAPPIEKNNSTETPAPAEESEIIPHQPAVIPNSRVLKELAEARGIRIGGYHDYELRSETHDRIFEQEFNTMTTGIFWTDGSRESRNEYDFSEMDSKVSWGEAHDMELHGHALIWFDDIPDWVKAASKNDVEAIMNEHIDTVVGRYAGKIKVWDVVNEAVNDDGTLRQNHKWVEAMGNDYIRKAFVRAHATDPNAVLRYNDYLYNDYFIENNKKNSRASRPYSST